MPFAVPIPYITDAGQIDRRAVMQAATRQARSWQRQFPGLSWGEAMKHSLGSLWPTVSQHHFVAQYRLRNQ